MADSVVTPASPNGFMFLGVKGKNAETLTGLYIVAADGELKNGKLVYYKVEGGNIAAWYETSCHNRTFPFIW